MYRSLMLVVHDTDGDSAAVPAGRFVAAAPTTFTGFVDDPDTAAV
jgi:hypothetical protein